MWFRAVLILNLSIAWAATTIEPFTVSDRGPSEHTSGKTRFMSSELERKLIETRVNRLGTGKDRIVQAVEAYITHVEYMRSVWLDHQADHQGPTFDDMLQLTDLAWATLMGLADNIDEHTSRIGTKGATEDTTSTVRPSNPNINNNRHAKTSDDQVTELATVISSRMFNFIEELGEKKCNEMSEIKKLKTENADLKKRTQSLEYQAKQAEKQMQAMSTAINSLTSKFQVVEEMDKTVQEARRDITEIQQRLGNTSVTDSIAELAKEVEHNQREHRENENSQEQKMNNLERRLDELEKVSNNQNHTLDLESRLDELEKASNNQNHTLDLIVDQTERRITTVQEELSSLKQKDEQHEMEIKTIQNLNLENRLNQSESEILAVKEKETLVTQKVADSMIALGDLQTRIESAETSGANVNSRLETKIDDVNARLGDVNGTLQTLENRKAVGFSAHSSGAYHALGATVNDFNRVISNWGGHYDPSTSIFTVPEDGFYLVTLTLWKWTTGSINAQVIRSPQGSSEQTEVGHVGGAQQYIISTSVQVHQLVKGDKLWVKINFVSGGARIVDPSMFSVFLFR